MGVEVTPTEFEAQDVSKAVRCDWWYAKAIHNAVSVTGKIFSKTCIDIGPVSIGEQNPRGGGKVAGGGCQIAGVWYFFLTRTLVVFTSSCHDCFLHILWQAEADEKNKNASSAQKRKNELKGQIAAVSVPNLMLAPESHRQSAYYTLINAAQGGERRNNQGTENQFQNDQNQKQGRDSKLFYSAA